VIGRSHQVPAVLAADGGASKTDVWLVGADGTVLGAARGEGSNHQFAGLEGAIAALGSTVDAALESSGRSAGTRPAAVTGVYCLAGVDLPVDVETLTPAIAAERWSAVDLLHNDTMAVLRAGTTTGWGIGVVCGSGLNCVGRGPDGSVVRFPSLAELSGDFASGGSWLGVRALGLALRSRDGRGGPTVLATAVPAHFGLPDPEAVLAAVYTGAIEYGRLFELAKVCVDAAAQGDEASGGAVEFLADEIVAMTAATVHRLGVDRDPVEVVLAGGILEGAHSVLRDAVEAGVWEVAPDALFRRLWTPPVLGAALLGLDASGGDAAAEDRLRGSAPKPDSETAPS
jgi:N-acetylglucosamine kinase-like BadF-type ATPase